MSRESFSKKKRGKSFLNSSSANNQHPTSDPQSICDGIMTASYWRKRKKLIFFKSPQPFPEPFVPLGLAQHFSWLNRKVPLPLLMTIHFLSWFLNTHTLVLDKCSHTVFNNKNKNTFKCSNFFSCNSITFHLQWCILLMRKTPGSIPQRLCHFHDNALYNNKLLQYYGSHFVAKCLNNLFSFAICISQQWLII